MREAYFSGTKQSYERLEFAISPLHMLCSLYQGDNAPNLVDVQTTPYAKRNNRMLYLMSYSKEARTKEQRAQRQTQLLQLNGVLSVAPVYRQEKNILVPSGAIEVITSGKRTDLEKIVTRLGYRIEGGKEGEYLLGSLEPAPKVSPLGLACALWQHESIVKAQPVFLKRRKNVQ